MSYKHKNTVIIKSFGLASFLNLFIPVTTKMICKLLIFTCILEKKTRSKNVIAIKIQNQQLSFSDFRIFCSSRQHFSRIILLKVLYCICIYNLEIGLFTEHYHLENVRDRLRTVYWNRHLNAMV